MSQAGGLRVEIANAGHYRGLFQVWDKDGNEITDAQEKRLRKLFSSARIMLAALRDIDSSLTGSLPVTNEIKSIARAAIKSAEGRA